MPKITIGTVIKLLLASFIVGMALAYFEVSPADLIVWAQQSFTEFAGNASKHVQWALTYILLGAVIVVPVWLLFFVMRAIGGRNKDRN